MLIKTLCVMVELFDFSGWYMVADRYFIPALQVAFLKTTSLTKIRLFHTVAMHFAKGYYEIERCVLLRPEYDIKERAIDWLRTTFSLLISLDSSDRKILQTSLLFAEFLIQSRFRHEGALHLEPRKAPFRDLIDAKKLLVFSCDQAALQMVFSVRLSVTPFWLCSHHRIIMKFSGVITNDERKVHAKGQGQRSKVKVTEVTTQLNRFRTVTPVWIHIWWWSDAYSLMLLRRGALLFFKVIRQISRSHCSKNRPIWPGLGVSGL